MVSNWVNTCNQKILRKSSLDFDYGQESKVTYVEELGLALNYEIDSSFKGFGPKGKWNRCMG